MKGLVWMFPGTHNMFEHYFFLNPEDQRPVEATEHRHALIDGYREGLFLAWCPNVRAQNYSRVLYLKGQALVDRVCRDLEDLKTELLELGAGELYAKADAYLHPKMVAPACQQLDAFLAGYVLAFYAAGLPDDAQFLIGDDLTYYVYGELLESAKVRDGTLASGRESYHSNLDFIGRNAQAGGND